MNYKVLYRKYRPKNFDEVVGQDISINLLKDSILNDKISHAYIFSGPRGTGKTSTAKIFAKTINCLSQISGNPCCECENCLNFGQNSDIYEIDAASNNGVDQIREIIDNIKLSPINSKYKVYIIDEVHMLSTSAFNALLLTLEEPPSHAVFILATTNIENVPITVLSRCQRIDFHKIADKTIVDSIKKIAKLENISIDDDAINEIALYSEGGMRDALSILDQLSKMNKQITEQMVLDSIGLISNSFINDLFNAILDRNVDKIIELIDKMRNLSADFKNIIKKIVDFLKKQAIISIKENKRSQISYDKIKNLCFELSGLLYKTNVNIDPYSLLELTLLSYANTEQESLACERSGEKLEVTNKTPDKTTNDVKIPKNQIKVHVNTDKKVNIRINNCFVNANKNYLEKIKKAWPDFINSLSDKKVKGMLLDSEVVLASDTYLVLKLSINESVQIINDNLILIEDLFNSFNNCDYKIIACNNEKWIEETEKYRNNLKNNIKYKLQTEDETDRTTEFDDVFSSGKIEIK